MCCNYVRNKDLQKKIFDPYLYLNLITSDFDHTSPHRKRYYQNQLTTYCVISPSNAQTHYLFSSAEVITAEADGRMQRWPWSSLAGELAAPDLWRLNVSADYRTVAAAAAWTRHSELITRWRIYEPHACVRARRTLANITAASVIALRH